MKEQVDFNKHEMEKIKENKWSIKDYRDYNYKVLYPEEHNDIIESTQGYIGDEEFEEVEQYIEQKIENIVTLIPEITISINDYRYCTQCGLMLNGQFPTVMGVKVSSACSCSQRSKTIYDRNKNYCGKCGNFLKYSYCSYCGVKNY